MKIFVVIECDYDGDNYTLFQDLAPAKESFKEKCGRGSSHHVYLIETKLGENFGFGSWGDVFGGKVIKEFEREE